VLPPLHQQTTFPTHAWSLQPGYHNSRALAASWLMLTTPTALCSTRAGYRSSTLLYFTAATGRATSSRRDAAWWMTSNGIGARRPPSPPFPKLHMLHNTVEFAERHQFPGRALEAQFESFHEQFNALFHKQYRNEPSSTAQWLRRSLADATLGPCSLPSPLILSLLLAPSNSHSSTTRHHFGLKPVQ